MSSMVIFKKEILEFFRTYKIFVVPGIFLLFGLVSPILTKLMPEIFANLAQEGFELTLPEMTWMDSYEQFFSNLSQIGIIAVILTNMGIISDEKIRGVAQLVLVKPVPRRGYILAKFFANTLLLLAATLLAYLAAWFYTEILFEGNQFLPSLGATGLFFVYVVVILALTVFSSAITKSNIASGGLAVLGFFIFSLLPMFGKALNKYSPAALLNYMNQIMAGTQNNTEMWWAITISLLVTAGLLAASAAIFNKQEL